MDPRLWAALVIEWHKELHVFPVDILEIGIRATWKASPKHFPSLGEVFACCLMIERGRVIPESHQLEDEQTTTPDEAKRQAREIVDNLASEMGADS